MTRRRPCLQRRQQREVGNPLLKDDALARHPRADHWAAARAGDDLASKHRASSPAVPWDLRVPTAVASAEVAVVGGDDGR